MTCKNCIHYDMCLDFEITEGIPLRWANNCGRYKDNRAEVVDAIPIDKLKDCFAEDMEILRNAIKNGDLCLACSGKAYGKCCTCIDKDNFELLSTLHDAIECV